MVFVIDKKKNPLDPCSNARARILLKEGKAVIYKYLPFTLKMKKVADVLPERSLIIKIDPGVKTTGLSILKGKQIVFLANLEHKECIVKKIKERAGYRRRRRTANLRYRRCKFNNRLSRKFKEFASSRNTKNYEKWLPPSLMARVNNVTSWVKKLNSIAPIKQISYEMVKFDTQKMRNAEISGVEYQQGSLLGYEVREYLLEKFDRKCIYCKKSAVKIKGLKLEIEHIIPRSRGGSNRIDNLGIACSVCNGKKGNKTAREFGFPDIQKEVKKTLKSAAHMNATRYFIGNSLKAMGFNMEFASGALTKMNRINHRLPKEHYWDAACVGKSTPKEELRVEKGEKVLIVKAAGRGKYCRTPIDNKGFRRKNKDGGLVACWPRVKTFQGFAGKSIVRFAKDGKALICIVKSPRSKGNFTLTTLKGKDISASPKYLKTIQNYTGYTFKAGKINFANEGFNRQLDTLNNETRLPEAGLQGLKLGFNRQLDTLNNETLTKNKKNSYPVRFQSSA